MFPDLISIGFLHLKTYGACMAVGFLLSWMVIERLSGRKDLSNLLMCLMIGGVAGSRIAYVIEHWRSEFAAAPETIVRIDQGGLMFYGGFILCLVIFFAWCLKKRDHPLALADSLCVALPLGHAFGRIGCFFYGCCYGRVSDAPLAVTFPSHSPAWFEQVRHGLISETARRSLAVLPTQLFEALALLALFAVLWTVFPRFRDRRGTIAGCYMVGYGVIRFGIELLRGDPRATVASLSIGQTISLGVIALGFVFLACARRAASREAS